MDHDSQWNHPSAARSESSKQLSAAERRRRALEQAQAKALADERDKIRSLRRSHVAKNVVTTARKTLQKINIAKWIDDLEKDQNLADELDRINAETAEEQERRAIRRQAVEECMQAIRDHLASFLEDNPDSAYEDWIRELHPDNVSRDNETIDPRFFVEASDHRQMWNESVAPPKDNGENSSRKTVPSRSMTID